MPVRFAPRNSNPKATIWIANGRVNLRCDYETEWISRFKSMVPARHRKWDGKPNFVWSFDPAYLDDVNALCEKYFEVTVLTDSTTETPAPVSLTGDPILVLCSLASNEALKKLHRQVALECHPDMAGGSTEKMSQANAAWDAIKKARGL